MILQRLIEYYERKLVSGEIAKEGWIPADIDFLIILDDAGNAVSLSDLREFSGKKPMPKRMYVPNIGKQALKHTNSGKDANLLWDNASFVFGLGDKGDMRLQSMIEAIEQWLPNSNDSGVNSVKHFLRMGLNDRKHFNSLLDSKEYGELLSLGSVKLTFGLQRSEYPLVFLNPKIEEALHNNVLEKEASIGTCLVTGEMDIEIEQTHPVTKGVWGAQTSGASIVSFNAEPFASYGKVQSLNAPIGKKTVAKYGKALNALLDNPKHRMQVGDASTVFWSEKESKFEEDFSFFFAEPEKDNPSVGVDRIKALFSSLKSGSYYEDGSDTKFYILGLSPNAARISIRFWNEGTISDFSNKIRKYFEEFKIVKPPKEPEYYSIWRILVNISTLDKSENIPPNIAGDFLRSILEGTPYPISMYQACLRRIKSDTENRVKPVRAALLKAYLNRYHQFYQRNDYKEVEETLDKNQSSLGYQMGRLFAILEKIQEEANPGLNATIRERYYGAACSSPVSVFTTLMRLKNHHLAKMDNRGRVINFEKMLGETMSHINQFPAHLNLNEQGMFAIGYYHQRQSFFEATNKEFKEE